MPFYEYRCQQCGNELEALQRVNDEPLVDCPNCHHDTLKRVPSLSAFHLKGNGWYKTDFKPS